MKKRIALSLLLLITNLYGCTSIDARVDNGFGHPYVAAESSAESFAVVNIATLFYFFPGLILTVPLTLIDVGFGVVTDTIFLPADLIIDPEDDDRKTSWGNLKI